MDLLARLAFPAYLRRLALQAHQVPLGYLGHRDHQDRQGAQALLAGGPGMDAVVRLARLADKVRSGL